MKKLVIYILALSLLCGATGCTANKDTNTSGDSGADLMNKEQVTANEEFVIATPREERELEDYPLLVGGHAHGADNIQILHNLEMGNFVWVPKYGYGMGNTPWNEENGFQQDVDAAVKNDMYFMVSHRRGLGDAFKAGGYNAGGNTDSVNPTDKSVQDYIRTKGGKYFIGYHGEELDADFIQSSIRPAFADRTPYLYDFETASQARIIYENELARLNQEANQMGGRFISNQTVTHHLNAFRAGNDIVIAELLEHLPNTELQLSYLRGGSQQFNADWGVWVSPWYDGVPVADKGLFPNETAQPGTGHKASSFRKAMYMAYVSGARIITMQETEPLFARDIRGNYKDVLWGTELKNFWNYAKDHQERMTPIVPVAMMIDRDNGWEPGNLWGNWSYQDTRWGKLPVTLGDIMLSNLYNVFLPGFKHTAESVSVNKDLYPGFFASSPAGSFDVVATDCSYSQLKKYPLVVLSGDITMNQVALDNLKEYVKNGGKLVINAYQAMNKSQFINDEEFFGFKMRDYSDNWLRGERVSQTALINLEKDMPYMSKKSYSDDFSFSVLGQVTTGEVIASDAKKQPVVIKNQFGRGEVYLTLTEYMSSGGKEPQILSFYQDFLKSLVLSNSTVKVAPADQTPLKDFSYLSSYQGKDSMVIAVTNHSAQDGFVTVNVQGDYNQVSVDVGPKDLDVKSNDGYTAITVKVNAEDITLIRIKL